MDAFYGYAVSDAVSGEGSVREIQFTKGNHVSLATNYSFPFPVLLQSFRDVLSKKIVFSWYSTARHSLQISIYWHFTNDKVKVLYSVRSVEFKRRSRLLRSTAEYCTVSQSNFENVLGLTFLGIALGVGL